MVDFTDKLNHELFTLQSRILSKLLSFHNSLKINHGAPSELKQIIDSIVPFNLLILILCPFFILIFFNFFLILNDTAMFKH
jgi:hypothetical protein